MICEITYLQKQLLRILNREYVMKYNWVDRVCVIDSSYSLLLYFLISSEEEIKSTFFFWSDGIPEEVKSYFKDKSFSFPSKNPPVNGLKDNFLFHCHLLWQYYFASYFKYPFLIKKNIEYWGHNHLYFSPYVIHSHKLNVIEDGLPNYIGVTPTKKGDRLKNFIFSGPLGIVEIFRFQQKTVAKEYLTGIDKSSPSMRSPKCVHISIPELWSLSSESKRDLIIQIYGLTNSDIAQLAKYKIILVTQTFSEDGILTEEEKISIYKKQLRLENLDDNKVVIKPHPREITNYKKYFPNSAVFDKKIPLQLLKLCGISFDEVYTVFSTAAYDFEASKVVLWGAEINEKLAKKYPEYTSKKLLK